MAKSSHIVALSCLLGLLALFGTKADAQILPSFGDSRTGTTGMQFLKIPPDARSIGMSQAFMAVVDDVSALWWNPAGINGVDSNKLHIQLGHTDYFSDINMEYAGIVNRLSSNTVIGLSLIFLNSGDMPVTTEFLPLGTGQTFRATNMALGLSLGRELTDNFSFGITAKYVNESIAAVTAHNLVFDFGFQYDIGLSDTRFAVGLTNFGFNSTPSGEVQVLDLNGQQIVNEFEEISVPAIFRLGLAWDALKKEDHLLTLAAQLDHPTDNNENYSLGVEYAWNELLHFRTGYRFGEDEGGFPSMGFGVYLPRYFGKFKLDYGFANRPNIGGTHRLTLGLSLI